MDTAIKDRFMAMWGNYFPGAQLPICFFYTDKGDIEERVAPFSGQRCLICDLAKVRSGRSLCFDVDSLGCGGAKRYLGFTQKLRPNFEYFLSCGIPGKMEGERYKKSPELVKKSMKEHVHIKAPAKYIVFKRWDRLEEKDEPIAAIFFAPPDVLSGLFTLANYEEYEPNGVIAPFCAGCGSIVYYPYAEFKSDRPRAVLGMFDVSARPCVQESILTFTVPMPKFERMIENANESFLITDSWKKVKTRIARK